MCDPSCDVQFQSQSQFPRCWYSIKHSHIIQYCSIPILLVKYCHNIVMVCIGNPRNKSQITTILEHNISPIPHDSIHASSYMALMALDFGQTKPLLEKGANLTLATRTILTKL